jgi:hypothetical protein
MSLDKLKQTLSELQKNNTPTQTVWVEVKEVDWDEKTMVALGIDDELEYYDVLLGLGSVDVKPKVGSNCLIGFINNSETLPFLIMADEVEEIDVKTQFKVQLNISDKGLLIEAIDKPININSNNSMVSLSASGIDISSDKDIRLNGGFEVLYNKVPGMPIIDISQIGIAKKVKVG